MGPENERRNGLPTYTMLTTGPNEIIGVHHDRMPVVLRPEDAEAWMDSKTPLSDVRALMVSCPPEWMTLEDAGPISRKKEKLGKPRLFGNN